MIKQNNNILLINKPAGWTSFDVVAKVRGKLRAAYQQADIKPTKRQLKVGHAGTLDPFATGLLILLLGEATKQADTFLRYDKQYRAVVRLGQVSTTGDPEGVITSTGKSAEANRIPTLAEIKDSLGHFKGDIMQAPPAFSALKVNGQRAYKLARQGKVVDLPKRQVTIYSIELIDYQYPDITIDTKVSSGTYIRSLAEDIGQHLGVGAYCYQLERAAIANYQLGDAKKIDELDLTTVLPLA